MLEASSCSTFSGPLTPGHTLLHGSNQGRVWLQELWGQRGDGSEVLEEEHVEELRTRSLEKEKIWGAKRRARLGLPGLEALS